MIVKEYGMDDLKRARELQNEMAGLHIPSPVLSWEYEIQKADGEIREKGIGKANSYVRNALNMLAWQIGFGSYSLCATSAFEDEQLNVKITSGVIKPMKDSHRIYDATRVSVVVGIGEDVESLDSFVLTNSGLTGMGTTIISTFDGVTRKLTTIINGQFRNNTAGSIDITETGIIQDFRESVSPYNYYSILMVRDRITAVHVGVGELLTWTYKIEVAYPNP